MGSCRSKMSGMSVSPRQLSAQVFRLEDRRRLQTEAPKYGKDKGLRNRGSLINKGLITSDRLPVSRNSSASTLFALSMLMASIPDVNGRPGAAREASGARGFRHRIGNSDGSSSADAHLDAVARAETPIEPEGRPAALVVSGGDAIPFRNAPVFDEIGEPGFESLNRGSSARPIQYRNVAHKDAADDASDGVSSSMNLGSYIHSDVCGDTLPLNTKYESTLFAPVEDASRSYAESTVSLAPADDFTERLKEFSGYLSNVINGIFGVKMVVQGAASVKVNPDKINPDKISRLAGTSVDIINRYKFYYPGASDVNVGKCGLVGQMFVKSTLGRNIFEQEGLPEVSNSAQILQNLASSFYTGFKVKAKSELEKGLREITLKENMYPYESVYLNFLSDPGGWRYQLEGFSDVEDKSPRTFLHNEIRLGNYFRAESLLGFLEYYMQNENIDVFAFPDIIFGDTVFDDMCALSPASPWIPRMYSPSAFYDEDKGVKQGVMPGKKQGLAPELFFAAMTDPAIFKGVLKKFINTLDSNLENRSDRLDLIYKLLKLPIFVDEVQRKKKISEILHFFNGGSEEERAYNSDQALLFRGLFVKRNFHDEDGNNEKRKLESGRGIFSLCMAEIPVEDELDVWDPMDRRFVRFSTSKVLENMKNYGVVFHEQDPSKVMVFASKANANAVTRFLDYSDKNCLSFVFLLTAHQTDSEGNKVHLDLDTFVKAKELLKDSALCFANKLSENSLKDGVMANFNGNLDLLNKLQSRIGEGRSFDPYHPELSVPVSPATAKVNEPYAPQDDYQASTRARGSFRNRQNCVEL